MTDRRWAQGLRACAVLAAALAAGTAAAQDKPEAASGPRLFKPGETISIQTENDLFAPLSNSDKHYTNGLRASWMSEPKDAHVYPGAARWLMELPDFFDRADDERGGRRWGLSIGQSLFTPQDTAARTPQPNDRPYAGWLYAGLTLQSRMDGAREGRSPSPGIPKDPVRLDTFQLDIGMVGPAALGRQTQNRYHKLIGVDKANGWNHQIRNEPGIMLSGERRWRAYVHEFLPGHALEADVVPMAGATLGNVLTNAYGGAMVRIGSNLANDFGPPRIRPALPGSDSFINRAFEFDGLFSWYLFAGANAQAVARNIFLDGNTFKDSDSIAKKPFVLDLQAGLAVFVGPTRVTFSHIARSEEFHGQKRWDQFGSISFSVRF